MNTIMDIKTIKKEAEKDIDSAKNLKALDDIYKKYLGKKGEITRILRSLKDLSEKQRKETGKLANKIKKELEMAVKEKKYVFQSAGWLASKFQDVFDITVPSKKPLVGHFHPITIVRRKVEQIFQQMGFSVIEGPEVETEWYSFDALNIPKDHPARDVWDTLWLKPESQKLLLRPHTSPVQIRYMEKHQPPLRIIAPGKVFRHEATDASHEVNFYQLEGLMVGKDISVANFKAIIKEFFQRFFNKETKVRLRPSFFPFTEPSFEIDISCVNCQGRGCSVCKQTGWVETVGAGMVHPNVLKAGGLNPKFWQGFAFGMGLDRLIMMKYKINDIRLFYSGDLRFLEQF
ncbi:MAG: phenylalanine--tRNA ligase subunit alpha [Minisyncoccales bacterium]